MAGKVKNSVYSVLILFVFTPASLCAQSYSIFVSGSSPDRIYSDGLDGGIFSILLEDINGPRAIAIDRSVTPHQMYIGSLDDGKITRYDVDGTNPLDIITDQMGISDIELDEENRVIYWLQDTYNDDQIFMANMDGLNSDINSLYATTTISRSLWGLALDVTNGRLWFTERGSNCYNSRLRRMSLDGTNVTTLLDNVCNPHDIEYFDGHIYYLTDDGLIRANVDGTDQVNISESANDAISIAIDTINNRVYWTNSSSVERIKLDGTGLTSIFSTRSLWGIDIGSDASSNQSNSMPYIPLLLLD